MRSWIAAAVLALAPSAAPAQNAKPDPDLMYKKAEGVSVQKPAKNDEWEFKDHGMFSNSLFAVSHKVDRIFIEVFMQEKSATGSFDLKTVAEDQWKQFSTGDTFKEAKKVQEIKAAKFPGGGAGNANAFLLDMACKDKGDKPTELKIWSFIGKENQNLYRFFVIGDEGMYKKHQKTLDLIMSSVRIYKPVK